MRITANNPEQEEAEEMLDVNFEGDDIEIGFNVSYILDVLNTLRCDQVRISMSDANASALVENAEEIRLMERGKRREVGEQGKGEVIKG